MNAKPKHTHDPLALPEPAGRRHSTARATRAKENACIRRALAILKRRMNDGPLLTSPDLVREYLRLKLAELDHEEFHALWLDHRHRLITVERLAVGTLDGASIYPREVVKAALSANAGAVIFSHNHPSGDPEPSQADRRITDRLKEALDLVGVRTLDHMVVSLSGAASFAERGWV